MVYALTQLKKWSSSESSLPTSGSIDDQLSRVRGEGANVPVLTTKGTSTRRTKREDDDDDDERDDDDSAELL